MFGNLNCWYDNMQQSREIFMKGTRELHHCLTALKNFDNEKSPPLFSYDS